MCGKRECVNALVKFHMHLDVGPRRCGVDRSLNYMNATQVVGPSVVR